MNTAQWIKTLIGQKERTAIPIMTHPGIELIGKRIVDAVTDGETHFRAVEALARHFPRTAASTTIMDLTVEAEAFGANLHMSPDDIPSIEGRLISDYTGIKALQIPTLDEKRIPQYLKADELAAKQLDIPVFAGCIGPFSLAGRLYDMTEIMMAIYIEPDAMQLLLEKCTEFLLNYCRAIKRTGVAGVIMAEPAAGLLSDEDCRTFSSIHIRRIVEAVQDESFAVILHNCGNTGHCTQAMLAVGASGYHFGNKADMVEALQSCPADVLVMGNIDPVGVFKQGTPEQVYAETSSLLERTAVFPNFVLSTGCDVPPRIPVENIEAFYQALAQFNR